METQPLTEALTAATAALTAAATDGDPAQAASDALADLAQTLAGSDDFTGSFLAALEDDLDRATRIAWEDGHHLATELARQHTEID
jgi:hypothetical protein